VREYLLVLFVAAATTYLLGGVAGRIAAVVGAVPPVRERDVHLTPKPRLGGLAMLAGVAAAFGVAEHLPFLGHAFSDSSDARAVLWGALVITAVGAVDDAIGLDAVTKLAGQVLAAGIVVQQGVRLLWIALPGYTISLSPSIAALVTTVLVVAVVNAVNFVDGLDGLAAGVVAIGGSAFFAWCYVLAVQHDLQRASTPGLIAAALTGVCLGFLPHNLYPSRIIMGDSGAMLLGFLLATAAVSLTGQLDPAGLGSVEPLGARSTGETLLPTLLPLLLPLAVVAVPFLELVLTVIRRTLRGRSPFSPDKEHLHHRLLELGHSHRRAMLVMWLWAAVLSYGFLAVGLHGTRTVVTLVAIAVVAAIAFTVALPDRVVRRRARQRLRAAAAKPSESLLTAAAPGPRPISRPVAAAVPAGEPGSEDVPLPGSLAGPLGRRQP
jgi:UDP-GlcNAc:undecaprenyl-phosphate GlcNAc-1-phosphate transferase